MKWHGMKDLKDANIRRAMLEAETAESWKECDYKLEYQ